jgi:hypothetical protein
MDGEGGSLAFALAVRRRNADLVETAESPPIAPLLLSLLHSGTVVSERSLQLQLAGGGVHAGSEEGVDA